MVKRENDRHLSRNGATKQIKKGGAGGKYTWGKPGDEYFSGEAKVDKRDPLYVNSADDTQVKETA